ncbi:MAG: DUF4468 domain-containing protein [Bacteroidales bacterium]|nr:DUF4468 domain-containing protein [Bacteroidales bacterium]
MKEIFSFLFITFAMMTATAQQDTEAFTIPVDEATGLITYKEVIEEPGTKDTLFNRGSSWLHTFYANPWDAAKVRDQSTGLIKIQHQLKLYDTDELGNKTDAGMVLYNAKIEFRDNRYRVQIDNFVYKLVSRYPAEKWMDKSAPDYNPKWESYLLQIDIFAKELMDSLEKKMKPAKQFKEEIW